jgi:2-phospho-L-lactate guanylyltransferase
MWALIPMKCLERAKSRLAPVLDAAERRALATLMLQDVLEQVLRCEGISGVAVITADSVISNMLSRWPVRLIVEQAPCGHSRAVRDACMRLAATGAASVAVISADVTTARESELARFIRAGAQSPAVVVATDRHGTGSNALVLSPPDAIHPRFGPDSLRRHREAAARRGVSATTLQLPGLALDIDEPADLAALCERHSCRSSAFLTSSGIADRVLRHAS